MQIRDTEGIPTNTREQLFGSLGVVDIQGVTMTSDWEPTACVEAIDYNEREEISPIEDLRAHAGGDAVVRELAFANQLDVPFYLITSVNRRDLENIRFTVSQVALQNGVVTAVPREENMSADQFVDFWSGLKGTDQSKPLPDARARIDNSNVDQVIEEVDLSWGGNVDGVLLDTNRRVSAIIEARKTNYSPLNTYDPGQYYAEDRNTWRPLLIISDILDVPLILLTFEEEEERCGFSEIQEANRHDGLIYLEETPYENLLSRGQARTRLTNL